MKLVNSPIIKGLASDSYGDGRPILEVRGLRKYFIKGSFLPWQKPSSVVRAVDGVDFSVQRGQTLGLVGESGCGKTTTGRLIVRLDDPTEGQVLVNGIDVAHLEGQTLKEHRRQVQMVFQDPYASLDPRMSIRDSIVEPLTVQGIGTKRERYNRMVELME